MISALLSLAFLALLVVGWKSGVVAIKNMCVSRQENPKTYYGIMVLLTFGFLSSVLLEAFGK